MTPQRNQRLTGIIPQQQQPTGMQQQQQPMGIPQWLQQFLYSQGGMQGLLYQVGGIQGLLDLIQEQSQQQSQPNQRVTPAAPKWWEQPPSGLATRPQLSSITGLPITADQFLPDGRPTTISPVNGRYPYHYEYNPNDPRLGQWTQGTPGKGSLAVTPEIMKQLQSMPGGLKGQAFLDALPAGLGPTGVTDAMREAYNKADYAYRAAKQAGTLTPEITKAVSDASKAMSMGTYGPMYGMMGPILEPTATQGGAPILPVENWGAAYVPYQKQRIWSPEEQRMHALMGDSFVEGITPVLSPVERQQASQRAHATLKAAGWDPSKGYGPQDWGTKSDFQPSIDARNKNLDRLLFAISPTRLDSAGGLARLRESQKGPETPDLPEAPDPFAGLQSAINRDAYVNETLGGGFYGGLIPDEDAINTFGDRKLGGAQDPHFPTPQLALNPLPGESKYDTYAGWAADQGAAFGTAPWAVDSQWGHAQNYDDPKLYQQPPPPPTAWQPTPQFGNSWGGSQGWGNTSRNGQNNNAWGSTGNNQQQPMSFGVSPWDNPWGMR